MTATLLPSSPQRLSHMRTFIITSNRMICLLLGLSLTMDLVVGSSSSRSPSWSTSFPHQLDYQDDGGCDDDDEYDPYDNYLLQPRLTSTRRLLYQRINQYQQITSFKGGYGFNEHEHEIPTNFPPIGGQHGNIQASMSKQHTKKTGTTIAGCIVRVPVRHPDDKSSSTTTTTKTTNEYVVLAADTRATSGTMVADKACSKIHPLASNCWCCGAGTSADLDKMTRQVLYSMALGKMIDTAVGNGPERPRRDDSHGRIITDDDGTKIKNGSILTSPRPSNVLYQQEYNNQEPDGNGLPILNLRPVSIDGICNFFQSELFKYQGQLGVNLIVGNVWHGKAHLRAVHPHGSIDKDLPFAALGSGGLAAMAVLEEGYYKPRSSRGNDDEQRSTDAPCTSLEEGIKLVQRAVLSGIRNDLGSGSALDLCIIYPDGTSHHTRCSIPEEMLEEIDVRKSNDEDDDDDLRDNLQSFDEQQIEGVNGFGNQPFVVDSMKQRVLSIELDEKQRMSDWKELLGM